MAMAHPPSPPSRIHVANIHDHETLSHPLVLFDGHIADFASLALPRHEWFLDARLDAARGTFWPVASSGRFKAMVLLPAPGTYALTLRLGGHATRMFHVHYAPPLTRFVVRFYYQKCSDATAHEGFDAPPGVDNSDAAAIQKIRFNALLLQTATAEMFVHAGFPRNTFALEFAQDGLPHVHLLRSSFPNAEARRIHDQKLIQLVENDLLAMGFDDSPSGELQYKHAVILGCSKYNPVTKHSDGHTALGGGKVGVFGSCGLHTWPAHLGELTACSLDNRRIDTAMLMDDSGYRGTFWGNFATGIGAFIHELGHTFGLGHATSGIMSRGFDDMTRLFCTYEPDHERDDVGFSHNFFDGRLQLNHGVLNEVTHPDGAHWNRGSALQLLHCPWISTVPKKSECGPLVCWNSAIRGPVGQGNTEGTIVQFNTKPRAGDLCAVKIKSRQYLDKITTYTQAELAQIPDAKVRSHGHTHWLLLAPDEFITRVEVRAMAWIDGLRIHTNLRSTRWYGGHGGQLHVLSADEGCKINGFFGSRGDEYVGILGVHCCAVTEQPHPQRVSSAPVPRGTPLHVATSHTVGGGLAEGPHRSFDFPADLGAIVATGDEFVESIRVVSRDAHAPATTDPHTEYYQTNELVFALQDDEYLVSVSVRSGHWIDAVRFHTNRRTSPWFGGKGGSRCEELAATAGGRICGLFGRQGAEFVDTLGVYTCSTSASACSSLVRVGPVGLGEQNGDQRPFSTVDPSASVENYRADAELGAVEVQVSGSVTSVVTYSRRDVANMRLQEQLAPSSSGYFRLVLAHDEILTHVHVRAMCWVDAVQFVTNKRSSPWIGGEGGTEQLLKPSAGARISGFFGTIGDNYVGRLGLWCTPMTANSTGATGPSVACTTSAAVSSPTAAAPFAVLCEPVPQSVGPVPHVQAARGVLVAVQQGVAMFVSSFDSEELLDRLVADLQAFVYAGAQLHCVRLQPNEFLLQISASVNATYHSIEGLCVHTTSRCSSWFGSYTDTHLEFVVAPKGNVIKSVRGVPGATHLQDIAGDFCLRTTAARDAPFYRLRSPGAPPQAAHVLDDPGAYDVRVQTQSPFGVESVLLLENKNREDHDQHGWQWRSHHRPPPHVWCLPQRLLEHHLQQKAAKSGKSATQLLFTKCGIGAIDAGGAYGSASCPPPAQ